MIETKGPASIYFVIGSLTATGSEGGGGGETEPAGGGGQPAQPGSSGSIKRRKRNHVTQKDSDQLYDALREEENLNYETEGSFDNSEKEINTIFGPKNVVIDSIQNGLFRKEEGRDKNRAIERTYKDENSVDAKDRTKRSNDFSDKLSEKGWVKIPWEDKLVTSCFTSNELWRKKVTKQGTVSVSVPKLEEESMLGVVFVSGTHKRQYKLVGNYLVT